MNHNEEMRVIAVGDDDQNIYEFRGSDSSYMMRLSQEPEARLVEMTENYRSTHRVVDFANEFVKVINNRIKKSAQSMRRANHHNLKTIGPYLRQYKSPAKIGTASERKFAFHCQRQLTYARAG